MADRGQCPVDVVDVHEVDLRALGRPTADHHRNAGTRQLTGQGIGSMERHQHHPVHVAGTQVARQARLVLA
jgi:hypothetical protein